MKALVYHGPGQSSWESAPDPAISAPEVVLSAQPVKLEPEMQKCL